MQQSRGERVCHALEPPSDAALFEQRLPERRGCKRAGREGVCQVGGAACVREQERQRVARARRSVGDPRHEGAQALRERVRVWTHVIGDTHALHASKRLIGREFALNP
jgi:hypothetical protein